jgi:peptide/nickel transport system ATP-binding protein
LIADEPTTALDVTIQKQVVELLKSLQEEFSMGLLFITHDLALVANIADRIGVMRHGKLVEIATTPMLFKHPKEPYTKGLIACRPPMDSKPRRLPTVESFLSGQTASLSDQTLTSTSKRLASETSNNEPVLVIENVSKYYFKKSALIKRFTTPFKAVDQVNLSIQKGINFGLVGESGCGKTTLARLMVGLNEPTHGAIYYKGQDLASLSRQERLEVRKKVQYIFQNPYAALNPKFTIEQTLIEPMQVHHIGSHYKERRDRAAELLDMVGLSEDMLSRYPHQFSGGQRQRICIARALSLDPELIVCDESVSALDVSIQAQILNLLLDIQEKKGVTYVFISHDLGVVKFFADRLAVMKDGKIVESGASDKVYRRPEHPFTKTLLSSIPTVERFSENL